MSQRRAGLGVVAVTGSIVLAGCGFQSPAVTQHERSAIQGQDFSVGPIRVRDVYIANQSRPSGAEKSYLVATFVNDGPTDNLTAISSTAGTISLTGQGVFDGSLSLPAKGGPVSIQQPIADPAGPAAELAAAITPSAGTYVPVRFTFASAGASASQPIPVVPGAETTAVASPEPIVSPTPPAATEPPASD